MNYKEQLRNPNWQKKRLMIMERDNFTCRYCGSKDKTLNVHHFYYLDGKAVWNYPDSALITLCEDCHEKEEKGMNDEIIKLIKTIKFIGIPSWMVYILRTSLAYFKGRSEDEIYQFIVNTLNEAGKRTNSPNSVQIEKLLLEINELAKLKAKTTPDK